MKHFNSISKLFLCSSLALSIGAFAQKPSGNNLNTGSIYIVNNSPVFEKVKLGSDDPEVVKAYLMNTIKELKVPHTSLQLSYSQTSLVGKHFTYQLYYNNIPVYNATIKAALDNAKDISLIINETVDVSFLNLSTINAQVANLSSPNFVKQYVASKNSTTITYKNELQICITKINEGFAVQKIDMSSQDEIGGFDIFALVDENKNTVYQQDIRRYAKRQNSSSIGDTITVSIFKPNPITFAHAIAGGAYVDNNDADNATLTADRVNAKVVATFSAGVYSLANPYVKMLNLTSPANTPPTSSTPTFTYTRNPDQFEEINAFYHITKMQEYIQSMGFTNLCNFQTQCDAHGTTQDNSWFTPGPNSLTIGDGCVDDGEDADVFVHEYGHAVSHSANNNSFSSSDRGALDEAFGDYQATSYRRAIDAYDWGYVFPWDGIPACWGGRRCDLTTTIYPSGLVGEVHSDGQIWASAMMSIWTILGKTITDKLQYTSLYNWTNNMTMTNAATLVINADALLYGSAHYGTLCTQFNFYGLHSGSCATTGIDAGPFKGTDLIIKNSEGFAVGNGHLIIEVPTTESKINYEVFDIAGRKVAQGEKTNTNTFSLNATDFDNGTYILNIKTSNKNYTSKILRIN